MRKLQAPKRVGPPLMSQGSSRLTGRKLWDKLGLWIKKKPKKSLEDWAHQAKCLRAHITCRPPCARQARSCARFPAHHAGAAMLLKVDIIFQMLRMHWPGAWNRSHTCSGLKQWRPWSREKNILDGTTQVTCRASTILKKFLMSVNLHLRPCTGCQLKSANFYRFRVQAYLKI